MLKLKYVPDGPKLVTRPSANPTVYKALLTILAKKNNVPIEPPNSGPSVLLIITKNLVRFIIGLFYKMKVYFKFVMQFLTLLRSSKN